MLVVALFFLSGLHLVMLRLGYENHRSAKAAITSSFSDRQSLQYRSKLSLAGARFLNGRLFTKTALKGRWTVVAFVTPWCDSCEAALKRLTTESPLPGMKSLFILPASNSIVARGWAKLLPAWMRKKGEVIYLRPEALTLVACCGSPSVYPTTLILDPEGRIRYWQHGAIYRKNDEDQLEEVIRRLGKAGTRRGKVAVSEIALRERMGEKEIPAELWKQLRHRGLVKGEGELSIITFLADDRARDRGRIASVLRFINAPSVGLSFIHPAALTRETRRGISLSYLQGCSVYADPNGEIAKKLDVQRLPATLVFAGRKIVYHDAGQLDYGIGPDLESDLCTILASWLEEGEGKRGAYEASQLKGGEA